MGSFTTRLNLWKPAGSDLVSVTTDISDNMQKIEDALGGASRGSLGYAALAADQTPVVAEADLTGVTVTTPAIVGARRLRITAQCRVHSSVGEDEPYLAIKEGATVLGSYYTTVVGVMRSEILFGQLIVLPTAGAHTYKLSLTRNQGTGDLTAIAAGHTYILVEDIGL